MAARIKITRIIHTIHAVENIADCRAKYLDVLGGLIFSEGYFKPEDRDMALLYITNHMVEPMAPRNPQRLEIPLARYLKNYGQGFHSFEIKVDNGPEAAARFKDAGYKLASEYGQFFFVRQESLGGILLEVCELPMPNDPYDRKGWNPNWSDGHPAGLLGLDHIACVTGDLDRVLQFFVDVCDGEIVAEENIAAPQPAKRVVLQLGDTNVAFIQPRDRNRGVLAQFLKPPSSGIYSLVWRVRDESVSEVYFHKCDLRTTRERCVSGGFAIVPEDFLGARHEFTGAG